MKQEKEINERWNQSWDGYMGYGVNNNDVQL